MPHPLTARMRIGFTLFVVLAAVLPAHAETRDAPFINQWLVCGPLANAVQWFQFQATGNTTTNNGFSEVEVFGPE